MKEFHRRVRSYLDSIGATKITFVKGGHCRFLFVYNHQEYCYHTSSTPSDHRAHHKAIMTIKRMIAPPSVERAASGIASGSEYAPVHRCTQCNKAFKSRDAFEQHRCAADLAKLSLDELMVYHTSKESTR